MNDRDVRVNGWSQAALLPPEHLKIELTIFLDAATESVQVGIGITDPVALITLGGYVAKVQGVMEAQAMAADLLSAAISEHYTPF